MPGYRYSVLKQCGTDTVASVHSWQEFLILGASCVTQEEKRLDREVGCRLPAKAETLLPWTAVEVQAVQGCCVSESVSYIADSFIPTLLRQRGNFHICQDNIFGK